jgi:hypothetical protein
MNVAVEKEATFSDHRQVDLHGLKIEIIVFAFFPRIFDPTFSKS